MFVNWKFKKATHEGLPLMLRYPEALDSAKLKKNYPDLVVLKHCLTKVLSNGLPEADYNDGLFQFDQAICAAFEVSSVGIPVLIETFGGKRNYYIYTNSEADVTERIAVLQKNFPQEILKWTLHPDPEWHFIAKYSSEFLK